MIGMVENQSVASTQLIHSGVNLPSIKSITDELSAKLSSVSEVEDVHAKWGAVIYLLIHHPQRKKLNAIVDFEQQRVDAAQIEQKLISEKWSFEERYVLEVALYLYDDAHYANQVNFASFDQLSLIYQKIILNAIEIRLDLLNFADTLLADLEDPLYA